MGRVSRRNWRGSGPCSRTGINLCPGSVGIHRTEPGQYGPGCREGSLLAILILLLFLRNLRSTLVIAIVIPISVVSTFILVHFAGLTMNLMTLGGALPWQWGCW